MQIEHLLKGNGIMTIAGDRDLNARKAVREEPEEAPEADTLVDEADEFEQELADEMLRKGIIEVWT